MTIAECIDPETGGRHGVSGDERLDLGEEVILHAPLIRCDLSPRQGVIWRIFPRPRVPCDMPPMSDAIDMDTIRQALKREMEKKGWKPKPLAVQAGLGETAVRDILKPESQDVRVGTLRQIANVLDCRLEDLLGAPRVPVAGFIGAGGTVIFEDMGIEDTVLRPPAISGDLIALEVRGESMLPKFDPGDIIYIQRQHDGVLPEYLGEYCAVRLQGGETYLKKLMAGSRPGVFTLVSLNAADMVDVEVKWATPVLFVMPRRSRSL